MKRITRRSAVTLLLALALLAGLGLYLYRYVTQGTEWLAFWSSREVYRAGMLASGTVTDRKGVTLSEVAEGERRYAEDLWTRIACLHVLGDKEGNIGTGALTWFAGYLAGYEDLEGMPSGSGEPVLSLSIDAALNRRAMEALGGRKGAVLLSDYTTGEILCMYSSPAYDPLSGFDPGDDWYSGVYLNRCLSSAYTPGSVFKLVTAAAALEHLENVYDRTFFCSGSIEVDGSILRCSGVHGTQTLEQALANSCNCAFGAISLELGGETIAQYASDLGFTSSVSVSGIPSAVGKAEAAPAGSTALAWSGVGQSTDLVCPIAMLRYVAAIANGGGAREPTLLAGTKGGFRQILSPITAGRLKEMMRYNVSAAYGEANFPGLALCAKTGTAELGDGASHAWFAGFLDDPEHPYAFTVVVERGGSGLGAAAPVARELLLAAAGNES